MKRRALWLALALLASVGALALWQHEALLHQLKILGRRGHLAFELEGQWVPVEPEDRRRRVWVEGEGFLDGLSYQRLEPGLELASVRYRREPNPAAHMLRVLRVDPELWRFRLIAAEDLRLRDISEHAESGGVPVAVNASYFSEEGPVGLLRIQGQDRVPQGTVWAAHVLIDEAGRLRVENEKEAELEGAFEGFQGFPAIMSEGQTYPYMRYGGRGFPVHELARRTAVCTTGDHVLIVVTDTLANGLTLNELATVMGGLGCLDAMGLDGGSSTALSVATAEERVYVPARDGVPVALGVSAR